MTRYETAIDVGALVAIDMHTHIERDADGHTSLDAELMGASEAYFRSGVPRTPTVDEVAAHYRERRMAAVVFTVDASTNTGHPALSSEEIAQACSRHADVLIPFGSVDPLQGPAAVERARRLVEDYGVLGMKFHPTLQGFMPNDEAFAPLWKALSELGVVALFHTGQSGIGAGLPGGRGLRLRYSDPMLIDDVAADFPGLSIVLAHPGVPWSDASMAIAAHKSNVHIDLSGWLPKYLPANLVRQMSHLLRDKVLFGSDFPVLSPDRWMSSFAELPVKDEVKQGIFRDNAARVLGLV